MMPAPPKKMKKNRAKKYRKIREINSKVKQSFSATTFDTPNLNHPTSLPPPLVTVDFLNNTVTSDGILHYCI